MEYENKQPVKLSLKELINAIIKVDSKAEYKQAAIVMIKNIFEDYKIK